MLVASEPLYNNQCCDLAAHNDCCRGDESLMTHLAINNWNSEIKNNVGTHSTVFLVVDGDDLHNITLHRILAFGCCNILPGYIIFLIKRGFQSMSLLGTICNSMFIGTSVKLIFEYSNIQILGTEYYIFKYEYSIFLFWIYSIFVIGEVAKNKYILCSYSVRLREMNIINICIW